MEQAVNFDNLRDITSGDKILEAALFQTFILSSRAHMNALRAAMAADNEVAWKKEAHALKGLCLNLGAIPLSQLCRQAQDDYRAVMDDKQPLLQAMEAELARVHAAIAEQD